MSYKKEIMFIGRGNVHFGRENQRILRRSNPTPRDMAFLQGLEILIPTVRQ